MFIEFTDNYAVEASRICGLSKPKGFDDTIEAFLEMGSRANPIECTIFTYESEEERDRVYDKILYELGTLQAHVKPIDTGVLNTFDGGSAKFADETDAEVGTPIRFPPNTWKYPSTIKSVEVNINKEEVCLTAFFNNGDEPIQLWYDNYSDFYLQSLIDALYGAGVDVAFTGEYEVQDVPVPRPVDSDPIHFHGTSAFLPEEIKRVVVDLNRGLSFSLAVHFKDELEVQPRYFTYSRILSDDAVKLSSILDKLESSGVEIDMPEGFCA